MPSDQVTIRVTAEVAEAIAKVLSLRDQYLNFTKEFELATAQAGRYVHTLFGDTIIRAAQNWAQTIEKIGGVTRLTVEEKKRLIYILDQAIEKYKVLGQVVPANIVSVRMEVGKWAKAVADAQKAEEAHAEAVKKAAKEAEQVYKEAVKRDQEQLRVHEANLRKMEKWDDDFFKNQERQRQKAAADAKKLADQQARDAAATTRIFSGEDAIKQANRFAESIRQVGGTTRLTAAEQARANSTITEAVNKYRALGQEVPKHLLAIQAATQQTDATSSGFFDRMFFRMTGAISIGDLVARGISKAMQMIKDGAVAAVQAVVDLGEAGSQLRNTMQAFEGLAHGIGEAAGPMLARARVGAHGLISDLDLMASANRAMLFGIKTSGDQFGMLADAAIRLGRAMGMGPQRSLDDLVLAIGRVSPKILDNLGIIVKVTEANKHWADAHNMSKDAMTANMRVQAFYEEALRKIQKHLAEVGPLQLTFADRLTLMKVRVSNFVYGPGGLADWIAQSPALNYALQQIGGWLNVAFGADQNSKLLGLTRAIETFGIWVIRAAGGVIEFVRDMMNQFQAARMVVDVIGAAIVEVITAVQREMIDTVGWVALIPGIGDKFAGVAKNMIVNWAAMKKSGDIFRNDMKDAAQQTVVWDDRLNIASRSLAQLADNMEYLRDKQRQNIQFNDDQARSQWGINDSEDEALDIGKKKKTEMERNREELAKLAIDMELARKHQTDLNEVEKEFGNRIENAIEKAHAFGNIVPPILNQVVEQLRALKFEEVARKAADDMRSYAAQEWQAMAQESKSKVKELQTNYKGLIELAQVYAAEAAKSNLFGQQRQLADLDEKLLKERQKLGMVPETYRAAYEKAEQYTREEFKKKADDLEMDRYDELTKLEKMPGAYGEAYQKAVDAVNAKYDQKYEAFEAQLHKELAALGTVPGAYERAYRAAMKAVEEQDRQARAKILGLPETLLKRMEELGIHTQTELKKTADDALRDYNQAVASGKYGVAELQALWERYEAARRKASGDTTAYMIKQLDVLSKAFTELAQIGGESFQGVVKEIGTFISALSLGAKAADSTKSNFHLMGETWKSWNKEGGHTKANFANLAAGAIGSASSIMGMVGAMAQATQGASKLGNTLKGAMAGAEMGAQIAGPWGAAIGAGVGAIVGILRGKPEWAKAAADVARDFGTKISDELAKKLEETEKKEGVGRFTASLIHLSEIIKEGGGLSVQNVGMFAQRMHDAFSDFDRGTLSAENLTKVMKENLSTFAEYGKTNPKAMAAVFDVANLTIERFKQGKITQQEATDSLSDGIKVVTDDAVKNNKIVSQSFLDMARSARAAGLEIDGLKEFSDKMVEKLTTGTKSLTEGFSLSLKQGFKGAIDTLQISDEDFNALYESMGTDKFGEELAKFGGKATDIADMIKGAASSYQEEFDRISRITLASFNAMIGQGKSAVEAAEANSDAIDQLTNAAQKFGLQGNAAFEELSRWKSLVTVNKGLLESVSGINDVMMALANTGSLDADTFNDLQTEISGTGGMMQRLTAAGFTQDEALSALKGPLETIVKLHKERGLAIDDETQKLITQAEEDGILKKEQIDTNQILVDGIGALIEAVGGKLPESFKKMAAAGAEYASKTKKTMDDLAGATGQIQDNLDNTDWKTWAERAGDAIDDTAGKIDRLTYGSSPGGLKEWKPMLENAWTSFKKFAVDAGADIGKLSDSIDQFSVDTNLKMGVPELVARMTDKGVPRTLVPLEGPGTPVPDLGGIHVHMENLQIKAFDRSDMQECVEKEVIPEITANLEDNVRGILERWKRAING